MNEHFYLPKKNRISIITMLALALILHLISLSFSKNNDNIFKEEDSLVARSTEQRNQVSELRLTSFDPNIADKEALIKQGISEYAVNNLIKLRSTGWKVKQPEDLLTVYGIDSIVYIKLKDRIAIEQRAVKREISNYTGSRASKPNDRPFDPNLASDQDLLDQGFSKYAATNLRRYLERGGRVESKADLKKIYGVDEEMYSAMEGRVFIREVLAELGLDSSAMLNGKLEITTVFDPNTSSLEELEHQGIDRKTAYSLIRYREKGGVIRKKEQLRKIYGMSDSLYASLEERIIISVDTSVISNNSFPKDSSKATKGTPDTTVYNLNSITQEELLSIKGIGPYYSKAIIEYRNKLGGYYRIEQLLEIPAFKEEQYNRLIGRFRVEGNISRISPVEEFKELLRHPYIDYELAKKFKTMSVFDMEDRIQEMISTGQIEDKLIPYLQKY
ncbi:MAG: DNA uptake protein ComE-like DNA-binding protein [Saprospiraceae bacterium]|jgi:DNA uptake protein ComE-like DNA-binding protein